MAKPKILIYCNVFDTVVGQSIPYMDFLSLFGDVIIISTEMNLDYWVKAGDILALPGGQDLLSVRYKTPPGWFTKNVNSHFEYLDEHLLLPWLKTNKPIIGICRGMQALNVAMGGTLHRHIDGHVQSDRLERWDTPDEMYTNLKDYHIHMINSFHHQAVKDVAPGFEVIGWSDYSFYDQAMKYEGNFRSYGYNKANPKVKGDRPHSDKYLRPMVPEIMVHKSLPYIAFQYHPEELKDELSIGLISNMLKDYFKKNNIPEYENQAVSKKITTD